MNNIIINADDFGLSPNVNAAIIELLRTNRIQRTTMMVNMQYTKDAYLMIKKYDLLDKVGLHINLTDGNPLSEKIKNTRFVQNGKLNHSEVESGTRLYVCKHEADAIREEVQAQFEKFKELFGHYPKHVDSHRHIHNYIPFLLIIMNISKRCGVESMRIPINLYDRKNAGICKKSYKYFVIKLINNCFKSTDYMGAYLEYKNYFNDTENKMVEIMVHPSFHNGNIVDIIFDNDNEEYYDFNLISK